ncbi:N6-adenosine-specific RNA methylase IME4 [Bradyrhizobium sp. i1.4.4]
MTELVPYDQARIMLAEAKTVDDVKQIHDKAAAMAEYRRRAGDRSLEIDAVEIRMFAQRRLGQMLAAQKQTVGLHPGGRPSEKTGAAPEPVLRPTLADAGISKKLSSQAQKMAALPPEAFEAKLTSWREEARVADRVTTNLLEVGRAHEQRQARRDLAQALSDTALELTGSRRYPAVYFDPPWRRKQGLTDRSYENHYPTMTWPEIIAWARSMRDRLLDDAWGFMWIPRAHLFVLLKIESEVTIAATGEVVTAWVEMPLAWAVAQAMGFDAFSTCFVWTKTDAEHPDDIGAGILVRDQDELLLLFKKGRGLPKPKSDEIFGSNHRERSRPLGHSRKPQFYREMIVKMTGGIPVLECFARHDANFPLPPNWDSWGNEAAPPGTSINLPQFLPAHEAKSLDEIGQLASPMPQSSDGCSSSGGLR